MRLPVTLQSLLIQGLAVLLAVVLYRLLDGYRPSLAQIALAQGAIAALLSRFAGQARWWHLLHLVFLPAVVLAQRLNIPPSVYLAAFLLLVLFYWSSFRTQVPLYLSSRKAWDALAALLPAAAHFSFVDLGSGIGSVPLHLERRFPQARFHGVEIAPAPWFISWLRGRLRGSGARFARRDYAALDLAEFDVVFAFLSPAAMPGLWRQASAQMRRGSLFISQAFPVASRPPDHVLGQGDGARHTLYAWRM